MDAVTEGEVSQHRASQIEPIGIVVPSRIPVGGAVEQEHTGSRRQQLTVELDRLRRVPRQNLHGRVKPEQLLDGILEPARIRQPATLAASGCSARCSSELESRFAVVS